MNDAPDVKQSTFSLRHASRWMRFLTLPWPLSNTSSERAMTIQCSWKSVLLLAVVLVAVQYTAVRILSSDLRAEPFVKRINQRAFCADDSTKRTQVLLLTTARCGSSFTAEVLNQHPDVLYLYEPLYHVQDSLVQRIRNSSDRQLMMGASRDLLWNLFQCNMNALETYLRPFPKNHITAMLFKFTRNRMMCRRPLCDVDASDSWECQRKCHVQNLTKIAEVCSEKPVVAMKTIRIPGLEDVRSLLEDPRLNLKVIQLVRDPRGALNSRMRTFPDLYVPWNRWQASGKKPPIEDLHQAETLCSNFLHSVSTAFSLPAWLNGKYMLVRYEDLSQYPLEKTQEIYDFVGLRMTPSVEAWIQANTNGTSGPTVGSAEHAEKWRSRLRFEIVEHIQEVCQRAMRLLGYRDARSADELKDFSTSLVLDKTFLPFL